MATLSSTGIGSGLDVKSMVTQLVALEKQPLTRLKTQAATIDAKVSAYGQIKSLISSLADVAGQLNSVTGWNGVTTSSSNSTAVSVSAIGGTAAGQFSVAVQTLAQSQASASQALLPVGGALGAGTLHLDAGSWNALGTVFTPGTGNVTVDVVIAAGDTVANIASKINGSSANVTATVINDASGDRLLLRSKNSGSSNGFQLTVTDADTTDTDNAGLSRLVFGSSNTQLGVNAAATVNGIAVTSTSNTFATTVPGVTFTALQVTTTPAVLTISQDAEAIRKHISDFVSAYNAVNSALVEATKYDQATKTAGILQGDPTAVGLQYALRGILQSAVTGGSFAKLADIGITQQLGGDLALDAAKLSTAMQSPLDVKNLFRASTGTASTDGLAVKLKAFTDGLMAASGMFATKTAALKRETAQNDLAQEKVNARAATVEAQLTKRYTALDAQMAQLTSLNAYVTQQVTTWNKNTA